MIFNMDSYSHCYASPIYGFGLIDPPPDLFTISIIHKRIFMSEETFKELRSGVAS